MSATISPDQFDAEERAVVQPCLMGAHEGASELAELRRRGWAFPKIRRYLQRAYPGQAPPSLSVIGDHLAGNCRCGR